MKLHANAAARSESAGGWSCRVVEQGWSLTKAAEAAGVSERTVLEVGRALPRRGRGRAAGSLLGAAVDPASHAGGARRGDRAAAPAADDRRGDRDVSGDGALDGLGGADADRAGQAQPPGAARAAQPLRAPPRRASCCTSTSRSSGGSPAPGTASPATAPARTPTRRARRHGERRRAGSSCTSASTTPPAWPTSRSSPTRRPPPPSRFLRRAVAFYAATASPSSA